jgi:hypothetical protein
MTVEMAARREQDEDDTVNGPFLFGEGEQARRLHQPLERDELLQRLTALMQITQGCERVRVIEVTRLDPPDSSGCNWSSSLVLDPAGVEAEVYSLGYAHMFHSARESWNLK